MLISCNPFISNIPSRLFVAPKTAARADIISLKQPILTFDNETPVAKFLSGNCYLMFYICTVILFMQNFNFVYKVYAKCESNKKQTNRNIKYVKLQV